MADPTRDETDTTGTGENDPPPPRRRVGHDPIGNRYYDSLNAGDPRHNATPLQLSELLQRFQRGGSEALAPFLAQASDNDYARTARESILYHGIGQALEQGLDPASPEFQAALESWSQSPEAQQMLQDVNIYEFFRPNFGNEATRGSGSINDYLDGLNNDEQMTRLRELYGQYQSIMGGLGDTSDINPFGGGVDANARQLLLSEGPEAFQRWVEQNVATERTARDNALRIAKELGVEGEYGQRPAGGWGSAAEYLGAQQRYQSAFDAFKARPRQQAKDRRNVQNLYDQWQQQTSPFMTQGMPFEAPHNFPGSSQPGAPSYAPPASGGMGAMGGGGADPFAAFRQGPATRANTPNTFWSPLQQAPMTPQQAQAQQRLQQNRTTRPAGW